MDKIRFFLSIQFIILLSANGYGSPVRESSLDSLLILKSSEIPALNELITISVSDVSLEEFLRGVANSSGLNLDVQPGLNFKVVNNFSDVKVSDVLRYICRQYNLDLRITGSIISVIKLDDSMQKSSKAVVWNAGDQLITFDFRQLAIEEAVKEISMKTGSNVILAPQVSGKSISGYIKAQPLENALEKLAYSNSMLLRKTDDNFYILEEQEKMITERLPSAGDNRSSRTRSNNVSGRKDYILEISQQGSDRFTVYAESAPIPEILSKLSDKTDFNYFLSPDIEEVVSLSLKNMDIDGILSNLFKGSEIGFRLSDEIYLIGDRNMLDFQENSVIKLQNRSIDKLAEFIPVSISENLTIVEFPELNSLFVSGPAYQIDQFEAFISEIDQVVPVILIEVIIMYVNKSVNISTGIQAGIGDAPVATQGTIFPGVDMTIGSAEINRALDNMGWVNLGKVTPNFYLSLKALEEQGFLDLESTPKLATLNGHEAELAIGNTEYYLEEQTHLYGTQNPQQTTSKEYKAVNAELAIKIKPIVSADEQITLEIEVHQSDFTERISKTSPPGSVNRDFTSQLRVRDQEMILLGGLMEKRKSDSGSGTPLLSRIPVIKWFFSSRKHEDSNSKLSVLIKPTIIN